MYTECNIAEIMQLGGADPPGQFELQWGRSCNSSQRPFLPLVQQCQRSFWTQVPVVTAALSLHTHFAASLYPQQCSDSGGRRVRKAIILQDRAIPCRVKAIPPQAAALQGSASTPVPQTHSYPRLTWVQQSLRDGVYSRQHLNHTCKRNTRSSGGS